MRKENLKLNIIRTEMAISLIKQLKISNVINQNDYDMIERVLKNCEQNLILQEERY